MLKSRRNLKYEFFKLKNGQWLKVVFKYKKEDNSWNYMIVVGDTKRFCNDALNKTSKSPKRKFHGEITGKGAGIEPFTLAMKSLKEFENSVKDCKIIIKPMSYRLYLIYNKTLLNYGYTQRIIRVDENHERAYFYKNV